MPAPAAQASRQRSASTTAAPLAGGRGPVTPRSSQHRLCRGDGCRDNVDERAELALRHDRASTPAWIHADGCGLDCPTRRREELATVTI